MTPRTVPRARCRLPAVVLGVIISSGGFRHHAATQTYLAVPDRGRVLAAKAAAGAIGGAVFGVAGYAVTCAIGLSFTAATALAGTPLGSANFGPSRGVAGVAPFPFAAATAFLAAIALAGGIIAARATVRRDIT